MKNSPVTCLLILLFFSRDFAHAQNGNVRVVPRPTMPAQSPSGTPMPQLRWRNGEMLVGEIVGATEQALSWKSALFEEPLSLSWKELNRIDQHLDQNPTTEPFCFNCRDGSFFYGEIVSITPNAIKIQSTRNGTATLKPSALLSIRRIKADPSTGRLLSGPQGDIGWIARSDGEDNRRIAEEKSGANSFQIEPFLTGPGGALHVPYFNRTIQHPIQLPDKVDVEFKVSSADRLDFQFTLVSKAQTLISIETWDNELVAKCGSFFRRIRAFEKSDHSIALRLLWDTSSGHTIISNTAGEKLVEFDLPNEKGSETPGLLLKNKGRSLSLDFIQLQTWRDIAAPTAKCANPRVELADGRIFQIGSISCLDGNFTLQMVNSTDEENLSLDQISAIVFSDDLNKFTPEKPSFAFSDGSFITGIIKGFRDGRVLLNTDFCEGDFSSLFTGLRQLRTHSHEANTNEPLPNLTTSDKIQIGDTALHGHLVLDGGKSLRWLPVGGTAPVTPVVGRSTKVTRFFPDGTQPESTATLLYTTGGDVLPGVLRELNPAGITFQSDLFNERNLPSSQVCGIQFGASLNNQLSGFQSGWQILKGTDSTVRRQEGSLQMEAQTALWHPYAMNCNELNFKIDHTSFSTVSLKLFSDGKNDRCPTLQLLRTGAQVYIRTENFLGGVRQLQTKVDANQAVPVRLATAEKSLDIWVNGILLQTVTFENKGLASGLLIEPAGMWGNQVQPIKLSGFIGKSELGRAPFPVVQPEAREKLLTIPRFRKDQIPQHALVAANGDLLRGDIEAASESHIKFRVGLESLAIPRERVRAALWLKKPEASPQSSAARETLQKLEAITIEGQWVGLYKSHITRFQGLDTSLVFKAPEKAPRPGWSHVFEKTSGTQALEEICKGFGLEYRIESTGTIVLEPAAPATDAKFVQKAYWLKEQPFSQTSDPQAMLVQNGIPFPKGSLALWEPNSRQLSVSNTVDNHKKLVSLIESSLGGIFDMPTAWLTLTNGSQLGLAVDKFSGTEITGRHPIYGLCTIPTSQLYTVSNLVPALSKSVSGLESWGLTFAREPMVSEADGENSSMTGQVAKPIKLPLLQGGEFELSKEMGKVLVLDFWASWCGPCVKALPELISALAEFPADQFRLVGINQGEPADILKPFLEKRGWLLSVALDSTQSVGKAYGAEGIPHTVVIGQDGKIALVKTGYSPDAAREIAETVRKLLQKQQRPQP